MRCFHVAIIGGGVIGSAIAWELSKYNIDVIVFEQGGDVCSGTSKANSGVIHSGINSPSGSLKARFCVEGNKMMETLSNELDFSLRWVGKYVIAKNDDEIKKLDHIKQIGSENGVPGLKIHDKKMVNLKEPNVSCVAGLWVPTAGIISPYEFTISLAENATLNGVKFLLMKKVSGIKKQDDNFIIKANKENFMSQILVNAAGLQCREILSFLENPDFQIFPCRGQYLVLDKNYQGLVNSMIYPTPIKQKEVLGIHITPTIDGNVLIGPSAEFIDNIDDLGTTEETMNLLIKKAREIIPTIPNNQVINSYSGLRCKTASQEAEGWSDFIIGESKKINGLINLIGIESPGLTAAPAIAKEIRMVISDIINLKEKERILKKRKNKRFSVMSNKEKTKIISEDEHWGRIVCRCENITEAEVINALSNPLGARTISSVKYRCRTGMGRCQGSYCLQQIVRIMQNEFNMDMEDIKQSSPESHLFFGRIREKQNDKT